MIHAIKTMATIAMATIEVKCEKYMPEPKPPKHLPKSLRQLNQANEKKKQMAQRFIRPHEQRARENITPEQLQRNISNMFASLDAQRGWR